MNDYDTRVTAEDDDTRVAVEYKDTDPNLADTFPDEEKKKVLEKVIEDFTKAYDSSQRYRENYAKMWAIMAGDLPPKTFPYKEAANAHVPFMLASTMRVASRLEGEVFGDWSAPLQYTGTTDEAKLVADLIEAHSSWQMREGIGDFQRQMSRMIMMLLVPGDATVHSHYDMERQQNRHEVLTPDEFVVPYAMVSTAPDWGDVPYRVRILGVYRHEVEKMRGVWTDVDKVLKAMPTSDEQSEPEPEIAQKLAEAQGIDPDDRADAANAYRVLWYEGWMELPGQTRDRFVQAVVHESSRTLLRLVILEEPDWQDQERFDMQMREKEEFLIRMQEYAELSQRASEQVQQIPMAMQEQSDPAVVEQMNTQLTAAANAMAMLRDNPPIPPAWMDPSQPPDMQQPSPVRKTPVHSWSHGVCIEPLVGVYGLGYGKMEADYNRSANTALSQYSDAATLANCWGLITSSVVKFDEPFMVKPGYVNKVQGLSIVEVKDNIMELKAASPEPGLLHIVEMMGQYSQALAQSPEVLSGAPGKSGETYRGIATRVNEAVKNLTFIAGRVGRMLVQVGRNNMRLNSLFLPDEELFPFVNKSTGEGMQMKITRDLYRRSYVISCRSDMQFTSKEQKIQESNEVLGMVTSMPPLQNNPAFVYQAVKGALEARGLERLVPYLGEAPPPGQFMPPPPPPGPPGSTGKPGTPPGGQLPEPQPPGIVPQGPIPGPGGALPEQ